MKALLLAAGESSRFYPYNTKHKCLINILGEPVILHTIRAVKRAGITEIIIVQNAKREFESILGNGKKYGLKINYVIQKEPTDAGDAILLASKYINSDFILANGNRVDFDYLKKDIDKKRGTNNYVILLTQKSEEISIYGTVKVDGDKVLQLKEKPKKGKELSNLLVVGQYFLNQDFIKTLKSVPSTHYSLEDALNKHAKKGFVKFSMVSRETVRFKYPWHILDMKNYLMKNLKRSISNKANVSKSAIIEGEVVIREGATVSENAALKGPVYVGKNAFIGSNSLVRNGSDIEDESVVGGYMEVKNSLIMKKSKTHSGHLEDSVVGENSRVGAFFTSANVRLDRKNVTSVVRNEKIDTKLRDLGVVIGSDTNLGTRVTTMPGVIIGNNCFIGPSTTVLSNVDSDTTYYTKFAQIVKKNKPKTSASVS